MPTDFILTRTDMPPAKITGERTAKLSSSNANIVGVESSARQWFTLDLYVTQAGTQVAHVKYRGGSKLPEEPVDVVYTAKTPAELQAKLDSVDVVEEFVTGWPTARDPKYTERHETVCEYADRQWRDVVELARKVLDPNEEPEVIE